MPASFTCIHCGQTAQRNVRLKKDQPQRYCSGSDCQKARRRVWKKRQYHENADYRKRCLADQKKWRQNYPADQYQKDYRNRHPEYTRKNRQSQRRHNGLCDNEPAVPIRIQKDTLLFHPAQGGVWLLTVKR